MRIAWIHSGCWPWVESLVFNTLIDKEPIHMSCDNVLRSFENFYLDVTQITLQSSLRRHRIEVAFSNILDTFDRSVSRHLSFSYFIKCISKSEFRSCVWGYFNFSFIFLYLRLDLLNSWFNVFPLFLCQTIFIFLLFFTWCCCYCLWWLWDGLLPLVDFT